jgi:hypothetical protein
MWNPFKSVKLVAITPLKNEVHITFPREAENEYRTELNTVKMRSRIATQQISSIHEQLALSALCSIRSGKS